MMMRTRALARSFRLAVSLICSACSISMSWSQSLRPGQVVSGRVQIPTVTQPLKLAEPNPISLQSDGQKITSATADWGYYVRGTLMHPLGEDADILPVSYDSTGAASVNVIPRRLGKVQLMLFVYFADGEFERKTIDLQVGQSAGPPEKLVINAGGGGADTPVLYLDLSDGQKTINVYPAAIYKDVKYPIPLSAPDVSYKLINSTGAAKIDPSTGIITGWNVGQALLETSFGEVSTLTCIDITNGVPRGPRSRCEELLPPGRKLPPSFLDVDSTPSPVVKVHRP